MEQIMITKQMAESEIISILIIVATFLILPFTLYALEVGVDVNIATIAYITGLLAGISIRLIACWIVRRSNQSQTRKMEDENVAESAPDKSLTPSKQLIFAITILAIIVAMIYPIHLYAPYAKALFIPLIYWAGVILGTFLRWYFVRIPIYSSGH